jgi:hypothetical protein
LSVFLSASLSKYKSVSIYLYLCFFLPALLTCLLATTPFLFVLFAIFLQRGSRPLKKRRIRNNGGGFYSLFPSQQGWASGAGGGALQSAAFCVIVKTQDFL